MKNNNRNRHPQRRGFTLIEVMIVLFIITMIMGLAVAVFQGRRAMAEKSTALNYVKMLSIQVKNFENIVGRPPTSEQGLSALVTCPPDVPEGRWGGPYIESYAISTDPWGNEYQYVSPGRDGRTFEIWSYGPDMTPGTQDDIGHWMNENDL